MPIMPDTADKYCSTNPGLLRAVALAIQLRQDAARREDEDYDAIPVGPEEHGGAQTEALVPDTPGIQTITLNVQAPPFHPNTSSAPPSTETAGGNRRPTQAPTLHQPHGPAPNDHGHRASNIGPATPRAAPPEHSPLHHYAGRIHQHHHAAQLPGNQIQ